MKSWTFFQQTLWGERYCWLRIVQHRHTKMRKSCKMTNENSLNSNTNRHTTIPAAKHITPAYSLRIYNNCLAAHSLSFPMIHTEILFSILSVEPFYFVVLFFFVCVLFRFAFVVIMYTIHIYITEILYCCWCCCTPVFHFKRKWYLNFCFVSRQHLHSYIRTTHTHTHSSFRSLAFLSLRILILV